MQCVKQYSFDLSYQIKNCADDDKNEKFIEKITKKYGGVWYASDTGFLVLKKGLMKTTTRNHGYEIDNIDNFIKLIKEVNAQNSVFFDFIHSNIKCIHKKITSDEIHRIYSSNPQNVNIYEREIGNLEGYDKIIHDLVARTSQQKILKQNLKNNKKTSKKTSKKTIKRTFKKSSKKSSKKVSKKKISSK